MIAKCPFCGSLNEALDRELTSNVVRLRYHCSNCNKEFYEEFEIVPLECGVGFAM